MMINLGRMKENDSVEIKGSKLNIADYKTLIIKDQTGANQEYEEEYKEP